MEASSLQDRLRDHAKAFDGLLSLIPAKIYYGEDNSEQWKKTKQTKKEAAAARRGKLDPDSELNRNAKDVMDERARNKRKLKEMEEQTEDDEDEDEEAGDDDDSFEAIEGVEAEKPGEGLKKKHEGSNKKQKLIKDDDEDKTDNTTVAEGTPKLSKKDAKREAKREKKAEKKSQKKSEAQEQADNSNQKADNATESDISKSVVQSQDPSSDTIEAVGEVDSRSESEPQSPTFDVDNASVSPNEASAEQASVTTSVSSTIPPSEKPKHIKIPADTTALRARLASKIEALRAARKADGPDGKPIRTRQELIESRRVKQAQRKERKLELRKQARLEEDKKREEALASNSPGIMSPAVELDEGSGGFSFGRVAFADGSQMSHDLSYVLSREKKKGPSDAKTALLKVQNQKKRLQELDEEKRNDVSEKEAWLTARRRVEGEKIRDDEAILKKTVKRKETAKKKSEKAWTDRIKGVQQSQKERQKKREDNLKQRREEKVLGKAGKKKGGAKKKKKGGRPGFEGSFGVGGRRK